jgi:hypothetical protein
MSGPQDHNAAGRIKSMKNPNDPIGNRKSDLPVYSTVPQPTAPPRNRQYKVRTRFVRLNGEGYIQQCVSPWRGFDSIMVYWTTLAVAGTILRRKVRWTTNRISSWTVGPLRLGPTGCPEMPITNYTNLRYVTSQKSENLIYNAAEALNHASDYSLSTVKNSCSLISAPPYSFVVRRRTTNIST